MIELNISSRRLGSRAGMFKEARFSVVQDGGRRLMVEDGDKGRSLLLEDGKGGRPPPPFPPPGREGRILPSVHIQVSCNILSLVDS